MHAVINSSARDDLKHRYSIDSTVVPNVMDFDRPYGESDEYNSDMLGVLGLDRGDMPIFQVTRIVKRKGIEVAIDLIEKLEDRHVKLVVTGSKADDERFGYFKYLLDLIHDKGLDHRVFFGYRRILPERTRYYGNGKVYSISDAYANARACTYFSEYEGFGNGFLECVLAKKPIFVNNYRPVYWAEIGCKGFKTVMIEENTLTEEAVSEIDEILHDVNMRRDIAEFNFELGRRYFNFEVLQDKLEELFN
jgi:glycosyltransferase involved in cell wall biosynthesis